MVASVSICVTSAKSFAWPRIISEPPRPSPVHVARPASTTWVASASSSVRCAAISAATSLYKSGRACPFNRAIGIDQYDQRAIGPKRDKLDMAERALRLRGKHQTCCGGKAGKKVRGLGQQLFQAPPVRGKGGTDRFLFLFTKLAELQKPLNE